MIICVHLVGCFWILTASLKNYAPETWVARLAMQDSKSSEIYLASIYWAIQTLMTVGYGDIPAVTLEEMVVAVCWMVFGGFFYSFTIGNLTSVLSNQNTR